VYDHADIPALSQDSGGRPDSDDITTRLLQIRTFMTAHNSKVSWLLFARAVTLYDAAGDMENRAKYYKLMKLLPKVCHVAGINKSH